MIRFKCPNCESQMEVDESFAGRAARCPTCGCDLKVPKEGEPPPAVRPARATPRKGAAKVTVDGEEVEVIPPLETMVFAAMGFVLLSVVAALAIGLGRFVTLPWAVEGCSARCSPFWVWSSPCRPTTRSAVVAAASVDAVTPSSPWRQGACSFWSSASSLSSDGRSGCCRRRAKRTSKRSTRPCAYADRHDGAFPKSLEVLIEQGYLDSPNRLTCPAYHVRAGETTYILTPDINVNAKQPDGADWWPPDTLIVSDGPPYDAHGDGFVRTLRLSGDVEHVKRTHWSAYQKGQSDRWSKTLNRIRAAREKAAEAGASPPTGTAPPAPATEASP